VSGIEKIGDSEKHLHALERDDTRMILNTMQGVDDHLSQLLHAVIAVV
jgi:hypothetical protein